MVGSRKSDNSLLSDSPSAKLHSSLLKPLFRGLGQSTLLGTRHGAFVPEISITSSPTNLCSELILQCQRSRLSNMCGRALICDFGTQQAHILGLRQSLTATKSAYPMLESGGLQLFDGILADPLVCPSATQHKDIPGESVLLRISVTFMAKVYTRGVDTRLQGRHSISRVTRKTSFGRDFLALASRERAAAAGKTKGCNERTAKEDGHAVF